MYIVQYRYVFDKNEFDRLINDNRLLNIRL